ncbi:MAG: leucine-rich repeat protein [Clostridia bacterium]|nr:leucine-rich repeat protein [Clostridia bacterium]
MKKTNKIILASAIVAVLLLGIGYAAIQNITLNINGTAAADPSQSNFKVMFSGTPTVSDDTYVTAAITDDTNATINVEGLTKKGDVVTATYTVQNASTDLSADLGVSTTNSNTEYFTLMSELDKTSLVAGEATTLTVTVELTKTPIVDSVSATIGVQLEAMPVQPGEEGTSEGVNDFSQTPDERNEFGFYFDKAYTANVDGQDVAVVFKEDTSCDMYMDGGLYQNIPAGVITYSSLSIDASAVDFGIITVSSDGRQINVDGLVLELDESFLEALPKGTYLTYNADTETYAVCEEMPSEVSKGDLYICGDYIYTIGVSYGDMDGWNVTLFAGTGADLSELLGIEIEAQGTDQYQTSYGPILRSINGKPVSMLKGTFSGCTKLTNPPEIPYGITGMYGTFSGCTSLTTAPEIPNSVIIMDAAFKNCTSLVTAPVIPDSVTSLGGEFSGLGGTFAGCTSLTIAPEIPENVGSMRETFSGCTALTTAPEIPESVYDMNGTFAGCTALTTAPKIPNSVSDLNSTFSGCTALTIAPEIPDGVYYLYSTFAGCTALTTAPKIPNSVSDLDSTFSGCTALTIAPEIPESVYSMNYAFMNCTSLTTAPEIPAGVDYMYSTFSGCTSLVGVIVINIDSDIYNYGECFKDVDMSKITLTGTASKEILNLLGSTGNNYTPIP